MNGDLRGTEEKMDMAALVARAREGDSQAVADLYEQSYGKVYVTVRAMIKDEDAVFEEE